ncbi:MAG: FHIPEP family type III secretion protein [Candidatus Sericytochromatia bacterium]
MRINQIESEKMYTSEEITEYLNVSLRTTQRLLKSGELPSFKIQGQYRIRGIDALNYLSGVRIDSNNDIYEQENQNKPINLVNLLDIKPLEIKVNIKLANLVEESIDDFHIKSENLREKITLDMGFICPGIKFSDDINLNDKEFRILLQGIEIYKDSVDSLDEIFNKSELIIKKYAHEIISREEVFVIIEKLRKTYPVIVEDVLGYDSNDKNKINIGQLTKILKSLLREQVSIRNMRLILESIADVIPFTADIEQINEKVRESLSRQICNSVSKDGIINVIGLDESLEKYLKENIKTDIYGSKIIHIDSNKSKDFMKSLIDINKNSNASVIICDHEIRKFLREMIERNFPSIAVLSYREISKDYKVKLIDTIKV